MSRSPFDVRVRFPRSRAARALSVVASLGLLLLLLEEPATHVVRADITTVFIGIVAGLAMRAISERLARKKNRAALKDETQNTQMQRGDYIPLLIGRRRLAPTILDVAKPVSSGGGLLGGNAGGGKGGSRKPSTTTYRGAAWHAICVGPAGRVYRFIKQGKVVFDGILTPESAPSGTQMTIPECGICRLYWGERDQPLDGQIPGRAGIASRFAGALWIWWADFDLGNSTTWPIMEYEVECAPISQLKQSSPWIGSRYTDAPAGTNYYIPYYEANNFRVEIPGDHAAEFKPGNVVRFSGPQVTLFYPGETKVYVHVTSSSYDPNRTVGNPFPPPAAFTGVTIIFLGFLTKLIVNNPQTPTTGAADRFIYPCLGGENDGVNLAHALDQLMFAPHPWGGARDRDDYDMLSLEAVGQAVGEFGERLLGSVVAIGGEDDQAVIGQVMQDLGLFITLDPQKGKYVFLLIREPTLPLPEVPIGALPAPEPEIDTDHDDRQVDKIVFKYSDRARNYRTGTVPRDDDGQQRATSSQRPKDVPIESVVDVDSATKIAFRREAEEQQSPAKFSVFAQRDARLLLPGMAFLAEGVPYVLRLLTIKSGMLTSKVELGAYVDTFGTPARGGAELTGEDLGDAGLPAAPAYPEEDEIVRVVELPRHMSDGVMKVAILRVRSRANIVGAWIWLSRDGTTYKRVAYDERMHTGGTLAAVMSAHPAPVITPSVTFDQLGVDAGTIIEDLTGDEESWRLGRQIALVGDELMYVRSVAPLGGGQYRLDDVIRGRLGTTPASHAVGDHIVVAQSHQLLTLTDVLLQPGKTLYVKTQPVSAGVGEVPLESVAPVSITLTGKAFRPLDPCNLTTANHSNSYRAGQDVSLRWRYRSLTYPKSGAGMQAAGDPVAISPPEGEFVLRIKDGATVVREYLTVKTELVYDNADLVVDFGGEPASFTVELHEVLGGYKSAVLSITITKAT